MDFTGLHAMQTVVVFLTVAAVVIFFDYTRRLRHAHPMDSRKASRALLAAAPEQAIARSAITYVPVNEAVPALASEALVVSPTPSRPEIQQRVERQTVTFEMAPSSPTAPSAGVANQRTRPAPNFGGPSTALPPVTVDTALWDSLTSTRQQHDLAGKKVKPHDAAQSKLAPAPFTIHANYHFIQQPTPAACVRGIIQPPELEKLIDSSEPFTGLVVSIGVNDSDSSMWHSKGLMSSIGNYIATLLRDNEYACRTAYDEFLMVCPGERGAQSQRRLNHISERLWDYQLRGMGASSVLFSWGGAQVQDLLLADAVASATERMRETKRTGHLASSAAAHREVV